MVCDHCPDILAWRRHQHRWAVCHAKYLCSGRHGDNTAPLGVHSNYYLSKSNSSLHTRVIGVAETGQGNDTAMSLSVYRCCHHNYCDGFRWQVCHARLFCVPSCIVHWQGSGRSVFCQLQGLCSIRKDVITPNGFCNSIATLGVCTA